MVRLRLCKDREGVSRDRENLLRDIPILQYTEAIPISFFSSSSKFDVGVVRPKCSLWISPPYAKLMISSLLRSCLKQCEVLDVVPAKRRFQKHGSGQVGGPCSKTRSKIDRHLLFFVKTAKKPFADCHAIQHDMPEPTVPHSV